MSSLKLPVGSTVSTRLVMESRRCAILPNLSLRLRSWRRGARHGVVVFLVVLKALHKLNSADSLQAIGPTRNEETELFIVLDVIRNVILFFSWKSFRDKSCPQHARSLSPHKLKLAIYSSFQNPPRSRLASTRRDRATSPGLTLLM
jgi:hypothetical protein